jgi:hypothetical protein
MVGNAQELISYQNFTGLIYFSPSFRISDEKRKITYD